MVLHDIIPQRLNFLTFGATPKTLIIQLQKQIVRLIPQIALFFCILENCACGDHSLRIAGMPIYNKINAANMTEKLMEFCVAEANRHFNISYRVSFPTTILLNSDSVNCPSTYVMGSSNGYSQPCLHSHLQPPVSNPRPWIGTH